MLRPAKVALERPAAVPANLGPIRVPNRHVRPSSRLQLSELKAVTSEQEYLLRLRRARCGDGALLWTVVREATSDTGRPFVCSNFGEKSRRLLERLQSLGRLGAHLLCYLSANDLLAQKTLTSDMNRIAEYAARGRLQVAGAFSLLLAEFPVQVPGGATFVTELAHAALAALPQRGSGTVNIFDKDARVAAFPHKKHPGALNKVNTYLSEVAISVVDSDKRVFEEFSKLTGVIANRCSDDQAAATLLAAVGLNCHFNRPAALAVRMVLDPDGCKQLTLAIKSLGLNRTFAGASVCEGQCLQGRGTGAGDLDDDRNYRCDAARVAEKVTPINEAKLKEAVQYVLRTELDRSVEFEDPDTFWSKRWLFCVNGAHSKAIERLHPELAVDYKSLGAERIHRRVFSENTEKEVVSGWDGKSYFSQSVKLEPGKTRAIYAGDSLTYFAWEHFLRPLENVWLNKRVVLDPGSMGTMGMGRRIKRLRSRRGINVMIDYDDFNARHSLAAMKLLVREVIDHTGYDKALGDKLVSSFDEWHLLSLERQGEYDKVEGTLMSGHRATTFINSILNYSYIDMASPSIRGMASIHVGDDVYVLTASFGEAYTLVRNCKASGLALNPLKQSIGQYCAEFLRVCYGKLECFGYFLRSVAACVNGNWVNEIKLDYQEGLSTILNHAWTLGNRVGCTRVALSLRASAQRMCRLGAARIRALLTGDAALNDGPMRYSGRHGTRIRVAERISGKATELEAIVRTCPDGATRDYLGKHAHPLEVYAVQQTGKDIALEMKMGSYRKSLLPTVATPPPLQLKIKREQFRVKGISVAEDYISLKGDRGLLSGYPLLQLMKNAISEPLLADMVGSLTNHWYSGEELLMRAWGSTGAGAAVEGWASYSDACKLAKLGSGQVMRVLYNCYV